MERRKHAGREAGYSLIELLVALSVFGVILATAVAAYGGLRGRGEVAAAQSNLGAARSAVEAYYAEAGSYDAMTLAALRGIEPGVKLSREPVVAADGKRYCIESTHNGRPRTAATEPGTNPYSLTGPGGSAAAGECPASI